MPINLRINKKDDMLMFIAGKDILLITEVLLKVHNVPISLALLSIPIYQAYFNFDPNSTAVTNKIAFIFIIKYPALPHLHLAVILKSIYGSRYPYLTMIHYLLAVCIVAHHQILLIQHHHYVIC